MPTYEPSQSMKAVLAGARARYMDYDNVVLADLRGRYVDIALDPEHDEETHWLATESVKAIDDITMGRAVV